MGSEPAEIGMKADAILPAGGRIRGRFAAEAGTELKALIEIGGQTVLEQTLGVLRATGRVCKVAVVGPSEIRSYAAAGWADAVLPEGGRSAPANVLRALEWLYEANGGRHAERVLVVTTDLPFLTPEAINRFLDACPAEAEVCVPLIQREEFEGRFPGHRIRFVRLRDGWWMIGGAFLVRPQAVINARPLIEKAFAARKNYLAMAGLLGISCIARFITGGLTVGQIERRCREILGCTGRGVRDCPPELVFDIDRPVDYRYAAQHHAK